MAESLGKSDLNTRQVNLSLTGMTCSSCVSTIEKSLNKITGVQAAVNLAMESAHIIAPLNVSEKDLIELFKNNKAGLKIEIDDLNYDKSNQNLIIIVILTLLIILFIFS